MQHLLAPVCLFVYRRADVLRETVSALARNDGASRTPLYVFSDAADYQNNVAGVREVREFIRTIGGFESITITERPMHLGLARSIISGLTEVMTRHGRAIVVEDDLSVSRHFLQFMNDALDRFEPDASIHSICGYSDYPRSLSGDSQVILSRRASSWGWATWKSRWFAVDFRRYERGSRQPSLRFQLKMARVAPDLPSLLRANINGRINSWAICFVAHQVENGLWSVHPRRSLVMNKGFGRLATHTDVAVGYSSAAIASTAPVTDLTPHHLPLPMLTYLWMRDLFRSLMRRMIRLFSDLVGRRVSRAIP